jgi:hypothetical protein
MTTYLNILIRRSTFMDGVLDSRGSLARTLKAFLYNIYELYSSTLSRSSRSTYRNFFSEILKFLTKSATGLVLDEGMKNVSEAEDIISARRQ